MPKKTYQHVAGCGYGKFPCQKSQISEEGKTETAKLKFKDLNKEYTITADWKLTQNCTEISSFCSNSSGYSTTLYWQDCGEDFVMHFSVSKQHRDSRYISHQHKTPDALFSTKCTKWTRNNESVTVRPQTPSSKLMKVQKINFVLCRQGF